MSQKITRNQANDATSLLSDPLTDPLTDSLRPEPPLWLLRHRITIPGRLPGFFHRPALAVRSTPTSQRVTLLLAPGGFGKTTLLAECCRDAVDRGVPVAWLTLDGGEGPAIDDIYLAHAFEAAGLDVVEAPRTGDAEINAPYPRTALLLRVIEAYGDPVVLALDEAEWLTDSALVALVNFLVRGAPANLHIAIAGRELPAGLDVSAPVLGSDAKILTADELRFSREDIAGFFGHKLSRAELAAVQSLSAGWPIALRICHNEAGPSATSEARVLRDVIENWVETRLWYGLTEEQREFLLDVGLFEWFDAALLDGVLGGSGALRRLEAMRTLDGLLDPVSKGASEIWQLHPLIRDHCARRRCRETPQRYRRVHLDIARALALRGQTVAAMRHATEADDAELLAAILLQAGGIWLWLREGPEQLIAADRLLSDEAVARHPRLASARCAALAAKGRLTEARRVLASVQAPERPTTPGEDLIVYLDRSLATAMVAHYGCETGWTKEGEAMVTHLQGLNEAKTLDPVVRCTLEFSLCYHFNLHAAFDVAMDHGLRVRQLAENNAILTLSVDVQFGLMAMAQGRVADANAWYRKGERLARATFLENPWFRSMVNILIRELELERSRTATGNATESAPKQWQQGSQLAAHFAATDIAVELARETRGVDGALSMLEQRRAPALRDELPALARHLAALKVSLLADAGRVDEAQQSWTIGGLPEADCGCVDLSDQSWREAESVSSARLRLLTARGEFDAGRRLGETMLSVAAERGLKRTAMRMRVLCLKLEHRAGEDAAAIEHLIAFLDMFAETDYVRALVRDAEVAKAVLEDFLKAHARSPHKSAAESLLAVVSAKPAPAATRPLSDREVEVLCLLETERDDDIAAALGITRSGIRYHVGNIFRKLKVRTRREAVRSARAMGVLPLAR